MVQIPDPVVYEAKAEDIPLEIVYEDSDLLVVNKPKGLVVHPASREPRRHTGERPAGPIAEPVRYQRGAAAGDRPPHR